MLVAENIKFKRDSNFDIRTLSANEWIPKILDDEEWDVSHGRYQLLHEMNLFENVETLKIDQLKISTNCVDPGWTKDDSVIKFIAEISFPNLRQIFLSKPRVTQMATISPQSSRFVACTCLASKC
jgi:hypothetical protein